MTIFALKSLLSLLLLVVVVYSMYTMFMTLGGKAIAEDVPKLKQRHKISGYVYAFLFLLISWLCIDFAAVSRTEPSPRTSLHMLLALTVIVVYIIKVLFVRQFRSFYGQARVIGTVMGIMSIVLIGLSAGYYLTVSSFGQDRTVDKSAYFRLYGPFLRVERLGEPGLRMIRTDRLSIDRGKTLFVSRCAACHDPHGTKTIVGPGLQGLLKGRSLPVSKNPATAESIRFQLRQPMGRMPSFAYLSDDEMEDLIAYLNTL